MKKKKSTFEFEQIEKTRPSLIINNTEFTRNGPASKNHDILYYPMGI